MITLIDITVGTTDLRNALASVLPHTPQPKDWAEMARVRVSIDRENATLAATDRYTAGLAIVSVWDRGDGAADDGAFDLWRDDVRKILEVFKAGKEAKDADKPEYMTKIQVGVDGRDQAVVRFTDVSGLIEGEKLELPIRTPADDFPDMSAAFARFIRAAGTVVDDFKLGGEAIGRFRHATTAYRRPLVVTAFGRGTLLIRCSESFLGVVAAARLTDQQMDEHADWLAAWRQRLQPGPDAPDAEDLFGAKTETTAEEASADGND